MAILPAAAVDAAGGAVVAWQRAVRLGSVNAVVRAGPGRSARRSRSSPPDAARLPPDGSTQLFDAFAPVDAEGEHHERRSRAGRSRRATHARVIADGRALMTMVAAPPGRDGAVVVPPRSATLPLAGGAAGDPRARRGLARRARDPPLLAAGGGPRCVWTDHDDEDGGPRLHLALEGVAETADRRAARAGPGVTRKRALAGDERSCCGSPARRRARCAPRPAPGSPAPSETLSLGRAGSGTAAAGRPSSGRSPTLRGAARCGCACARARPARARRR